MNDEYDQGKDIDPLILLVENENESKEKKNLNHDSHDHDEERTTCHAVNLPIQEPDNNRATDFIQGEDFDDLHQRRNKEVLLPDHDGVNSPSLIDQNSSDVNDHQHQQQQDGAPKVGTGSPSSSNRFVETHSTASDLVVVKGDATFSVLRRPSSSLFIPKTRVTLQTTAVMRSNGNYHGIDSRRRGMNTTTTDNVQVDGYDLMMRRRLLIIRIIHKAEHCIRLPLTKNRLNLDNLGLSLDEIPFRYLCRGDGRCLGDCIRHLSLTRNPLVSFPNRFVRRASFPLLKHLDLSKCELYHLPKQTWHLPRLTTLNLSHNNLTEFPDKKVLKGLPELRHLNMRANRMCTIRIPSETRRMGLLSKLMILDVGCNYLVHLTDDIDQLTSLRRLDVVDNFISLIPSRICNMRRLRKIDVRSNPVIEPPIDICAGGSVSPMRRYWKGVERQKEQNKQKEQRSHPTMKLLPLSECGDRL